jgi:hypothetical protein
MKTIKVILFLFLLLNAGMIYAQVNKNISKSTSDLPSSLKTAPPEVSPTIRGFIEKIEGRKVTIKRSDSNLTVTVKEPENISSFKKGDLVKFQKGILEKLTEKKPLDRLRPDFKPIVPPNPDVKTLDKIKTETKSNKNSK